MPEKVDKFLTTLSSSESHPSHVVNPKDDIGISYTATTHSKVYTTSAADLSGSLLPKDIV